VLSGKNYYWQKLGSPGMVFGVTGELNADLAIRLSERPDTWATVCTGHMSDNPSPGGGSGSRIWTGSPDLPFAPALALWQPITILGP
jgi:hypothetical protein